MPKDDSQFYRKVILEHIDVINSYRPDSKEMFLKDRMAFDAILMRLVAIGEALSVFGAPSQLLWFRIIALRDRVAGKYWKVDKEIRDRVWQLLTDGSLDQLRKALR